MKKYFLLFFVCANSFVALSQLPSMIPYYKDGKYGYVSPTGKMIAEPTFTRAELPNGDLAMVKDEKGFNLINASGKKLFPKFHGFG
jgi:hypothetical protein